jgi:predicted regulator of Ras-like GTPase activity (Roadblock/LC7/MglB family)
MFTEVLQSAIDKTEGSLDALVVGTDGIIVEHIRHNESKDKKLNVAIADYTSLLRGVMRTNDELKLGGLKEITLACESTVFLMRLINENYLIAMILSPNGNIGRGRYELYKAELLLKQASII